MPVYSESGRKEKAKVRKMENPNVLEGEGAEEEIFSDLDRKPISSRDQRHPPKNHDQTRLDCHFYHSLFHLRLYLYNGLKHIVWWG